MIDFLNFSSSVVETEFEESELMSTYLVALIISDFKCKHAIANAGINGKVDVSVCARAEVVNQLDYALKYTVTTLEVFEKYFGIKYKLPKLDHVAIPDLTFRKLNRDSFVLFNHYYFLF